ncbi:MAG: hypothetical protein ACAH59_07420 [Pseudobdellovibrionaceae bacterium]
MQIEVRPGKKVPRLFLAQNHSLPAPLKGMEVLWPDRSESSVFDLSYSGMVIGANESQSRLRPGSSYDFHLRLAIFEDPLPFRAQVVHVGASSIGLFFDATFSENRLSFEQSTKDQILVENLKEWPLQKLPSELASDLWLHGPFDTNLIVKKRSGSETEFERVLVEYDNLIWHYRPEEVIVQRSFSSVPEEKGYFSPKEIFDPKLNKVSMGASWLDRWIKLVEKLNDQRGDLFSLLQLLKSQRAH